MYDIILSFITAFLLTYFAIPSIINIAKVKKLVDLPDERRSHDEATPSLGGIGIFGGLLFSVIMWTPFNVFGDLQYVLCSLVIIFLIGAKDDILPMSPNKKILGEIFAAVILVFKANVKITSLYGIFNIYDLHPVASALFSIFSILVIINAFNLIDGINGLSGSIGTLIAVTFGTWFFLVQRIELSLVAFALAGSLIAFLKYNYTPAKIFMGDTGALIVGLVCAVLSIKFIEFHKEAPESIYAFHAAPAVAIGIMIFPLYDTLRVFVLRVANKKSPFYPDRKHIHHMLIDLGLTHMQATLILVTINALFIVFSFIFQDIGSFNLIMILLGMALTGSIILKQLLNYKQKELRTSKSKSDKTLAGIE
jgi:UDP-N-acetylmuramyl pentapeptide phosphotransferase/UDP-N-acetylglucosamine-1-phosphate transferase